MGTLTKLDKISMTFDKLNNETYYTVKIVNLISQLNYCTVSTFESV